MAIKFNKDKQFMQVDRYSGQDIYYSKPDEYWTEIINIKAIKAIVEHFVIKTNRRNGYDVIFDGGDKGSFWINDDEYKIICEALGFEPAEDKPKKN